MRTEVSDKFTVAIVVHFLDSFQNVFLQAYFSMS
jgi:hypothetical protein